MYLIPAKPKIHNNVTSNVHELILKKQKQNSPTGLCTVVQKETEEVEAVVYLKEDSSAVARMKSSALNKCKTFMSTAYCER